MTPEAKITHSMLCDRLNAVVVETIERLPTGQAVIVLRCSHCGRTDQDSR
jgi:hypothetical protein